MNKNILIIDDEEKIRQVIKEYAYNYNYNIYEANDGIQALTMITKQNFDCIILDINMPFLDGFTTCKKIKEQTNTPIIMLSARQFEQDKLICFQLGVQDYITKPFSIKELMARINVVITRSNTNTQPIIKINTLTIDPLGRQVYIDDHKIYMTPKELDLLIYLTTNINIALSREQILQEIWNNEELKDNRTVDTHIKMLRQSLKKYRNNIITIRGIGYKFEN